MIALSKTPSRYPQLNDYIDYFWEYEFNGVLDTSNPFLPEGVFEIIFEIGDSLRYKNPQDQDWNERPRGFLGGLFENQYQLDLQGNIKLCGVRFKAGKFRHFTDIPLDLFKNKIIWLEDAFGKSAKDLVERVITSSSFDQREQILSDFFLERICHSMKRKSWIETLVESFEKNPSPHPSFKQIAHHQGLSERHLRRVFSREVGLSPKRYFQLKRLHLLLKDSLDPDVTLMDQVFKYGYFDQSHLVKDIKKLTGSIPSSILSKINSAQIRFMH